MGYKRKRSTYNNIHILTSSFSCSVLLILECVLQVFQHKCHHFLHISYKKSKNIMLNLIKIVPERLYVRLYIQLLRYI